MVKKPKNKGMPDGFEAPVHLLERSANAKFVEWANAIISEMNLGLGDVLQETGGTDLKQPDAVILASPGSDKVVCVVELKRPEFDVFNYEDLKKPAYEKASRRKARFYAVSNFRQLILYETKRTAAGLTDAEQITDKFEISEITDLENLREPVVQIVVKEAIGKFLTLLYEVSTGIKERPMQDIDDILVFYLYERIERLSGYYYDVILDRYKNDKGFEKELRFWFADQSWNYTGSEDDLVKVARQTANLLINKILFYKALQAKQKLSGLSLNAVADGISLRGFLQVYFDEVLRIDYETIFTSDFIDENAFPDDERVVIEIVNLIEYLKQYDFSELGYDIVGRIFEKLIPEERRHELGQYFTSADVTDLILRFCLRHEEDTVLDPGCGAGTFLVRAYRHKKMMNDRLHHNELLSSIYGFDIAKFPAHLATINLAIQDLSVAENYPRIFQSDFFTEKPVMDSGESVTLDDGAVHLPKPDTVDCVVGNPPYTRQEEMEAITGDSQYKTDVVKRALYDDNGPLAELTKRAGIHAYFFVHGYKFLKEGGRFGFIVSNSWLDVGYGGGLQEFFLKNYKIITIIESKVERWFEDADVNTCIVILEKCSDAEVRDNNPARFVYLKKRLRDLIAPVSDEWENQVERYKQIGALVNTIQAHDEPYENDDLKIHTVKQNGLWAEGCDDNDKYVGAKWGKYIRAPKIYFNILDKCADKLIPLKEVADIKRGFTTGADPWFYVSVKQTEYDETLEGISDKKIVSSLKSGKLRYVECGNTTRWLIEKEYIKPVIKSPNELTTIGISPADLEYAVVKIDSEIDEEKEPFVSKYIEYGETTPFAMGKGRKAIPAKTNTCSDRKVWYVLQKTMPTRVFWQKAFDRKYRHYLTDEECFANQRFYHIYPKKREDTEILAAIINSVIPLLFIELQRVGLGLGAIEATVDEVKSNILIPDFRILNRKNKEKLLKKFEALIQREIDDVNTEYSVTKKRSDRWDLDTTILGDILGLTEEEQIEVYRGVVDLVRTRLDRAASVKSKKKKSGGIDTEQLTNNLLKKLGDKLPAIFIEEYIENRDDLEVYSWSPGLPIIVGNDLYEWFVEIGKGKKVARIGCRSEVIARYIAAWVEMGYDTALIPTDETYLEEIVPFLIELKEYITETITDYIVGIIDKKMRDRIEAVVWSAVRNAPITY